jgi:hypothetical protein
VSNSELSRTESEERGKVADSKSGSRQSKVIGSKDLDCAKEN